MSIYLGPVGALQTLPSIGRGIDATLTFPTSVHQIAGPRGGRVVDRVGAAKRTYKLERKSLTVDELAVLEGLYLGAYGPGPFVLIEPWRRNLLSANQSSGTDVGRDTRGFINFSGTLTSSTAQSSVGSRSLAIAVTAANTEVHTGLATAASPITDVPVTVGQAYTASLKARLSASTGNAIVRLRWFTAAGTAISNSDGSSTALSSSAWTAVSVTATAPATAALARVVMYNPVMGAAQTIYLDSWQLEVGSVVNAWVVGTGVPRVSFDGDLSQSYDYFPVVNAGVSLVEV